MNKPPKSFWAIAVLAFVWNILGVYLSTYQLEVIEQSVTSEEFAIMESLPFWYVSLFLITLLSEVLGCFLLLIRRKLATLFFALSLISAIFIELYWLLATNVTKVSFLLAWGIPIVVLSISLFLYMYSKAATKKGWLK